MITISRVADLGRMTRVENLSGVTFTGEDEGHKFVISAMLDNAVVPLTGHVSGKFIRPNGATVALTESEDYAGIEEGKAWVILAGNCYREAGPFGLSITHVEGSKRTVIYACAGYIRPGETSSVIDPENVINIDAIAAMMGEMEDATEAAEAAAAFVPNVIAPAYSASTTYAVGDYVTKDGYLYRCNTAISTAEAWTAAHWTQVKVGGEVGDLKSAVSAVENAVLDEIENHVPATGYGRGRWTVTNNTVSFVSAESGNIIASAPVEVEPGDVVHIMFNPVTEGAIIFANYDGNTYTLVDSVSPGSNDTIDRIYVIPDDANCVLLTKLGASAAYCNKVIQKTDATLSKSGVPADAQAVGNAIGNLNVNTDTTLTLEGVPADAKKTGELIQNNDEQIQAALDFVGAEPITITNPGEYIDLSKSSVTMSDGVPVSGGTYATYGFAVVPCKEADRFLINGTGGQNYRLWGFVSSAGEVLDVALQNDSENNLLITAPENSAFLIIHNLKNDPKVSYKLAETDVTEIGATVEKITDALTEQKITLTVGATAQGYWKWVESGTVEANPLNSGSYYYRPAIEIPGNVRMTVESSRYYNSGSSRPIIIVDENYQILASYNKGGKLKNSVYEFTTPPNAKYLLISQYQATTVPVVSYVTGYKIAATKDDFDDIDSRIDGLVTQGAGESIDTDAWIYKKTGIIPSYYFEPDGYTPSAGDYSSPYYLERRIAAIPEGKHFIFYSDVHWPNNRKHSTDLIQYVRKRTGIKTVLCAGDIIQSNTSKELGAAELSRYMNEMVATVGPNILVALGDHDVNGIKRDGVVDYSPYIIPYTAIKNILTTHLKDKAVRESVESLETKFASIESQEQREQIIAFMRLHYYVDDEKQKIRYIVLTSGESTHTVLVDVFGTGMGTSYQSLLELGWLADTLNSVPSGYDVVVMLHNGIRYKNQFEYIACKSIYHMVSVRARKGTIRYSHTSHPIGNATLQSIFPEAASVKTYDFTNSNDINNIIVLSGDWHYNNHAIVTAGTEGQSPRPDAPVAYKGREIQAGDVLGVTIQTDASNQLPAPTKDWMYPDSVMVNNSITEQAFDVVTINGKTITFTRFGAGVDRVFDMTIGHTGTDNFNYDGTGDYDDDEDDEAYEDDEG